MVGSGGAGSSPGKGNGAATRWLGAVLVLAVAGGVTMLARSTPGSSPPPRVAGTPSAADTRFEVAFDSEASAEVTARRLAEELHEALRTEVPEARWLPGGDAREDRRPRYDFDLGRDGAVFVRAGSGLLNDDRTGHLEAMIIATDGRHADPQRGGFDWSCLGTPKGQWMCDETEAPSGATMKVVTHVRAGTVRHLVDIRLPGDRRLHLVVSNESGGAGTAPAQPDAPLHMEQAVALGLQLEGRIRP
ncbi:hypothetical protein [Micromonospora sp. NPDC126480]|uniref:hypothetical protein n=1 Tax=Micromonospora sp. NPDC126480 TaxID=3155312 RepID=UPI003322301E